MDKFLEKNYKAIIIIICVLGILLRGIYVTINGVRTNNYDTKIWFLYDVEDYEDAYKFDEKKIGDGGHLYYILLLYDKLELPDAPRGQYYHPPLHHFISAIWLRTMDLLPLNAMQKIESLQILGFLYSALIIYFSYKIMQELKVGKKGKILSLILLNFFPLFIRMAGFINNDTLVTLFIVINSYYLIKYNREPSYKNAIIIALTLGLGMMTKTSMIVMLLPAMYVWFKKLFEMNKKDEKISKLMYQLLIFIVIAAPLCSWHQLWLVTNHDWDLLGVQTPYEHFSVKDATFFDRWGLVSKDLLENVITVENNNIFSYVINSALYCLGTYKDSISYIIKELLIILIVITMYSVVKHCLKKNREDSKNVLLIMFGIWILSFIYFNITMPFSCTMHSRYIGILFIIGMIMLGIDVDNCDKNWRKFMYILSIVFAILSTYIVLI